MISRDDVVDTLQLAKAKADGAGAVVLNVVLSGAEKTKELFDQARNSCAILRRNFFPRNFLTPRPLLRRRAASASRRSSASPTPPSSQPRWTWAPRSCIGDCALPTAVELLGQLPDGVVSVCDVELPDVRGAWAVRDEKFAR